MHDSTHDLAVESAGPATVPASGVAPASPRPSRTPSEELRDLLAARSGERHVVAIQDYPDPDAISSALAYREIARGCGIEVDIAYEGLISHPENLALVNLLDIDLSPFDESVTLEEYSAAVFIDNQGTTSRLTGRLKQAGVPTFAVIDHHEPQDLLDPIFSDIRPVGAAATILAEYLESGTFFEMDATIAQHVHLATALMHGLHSETNGFLAAGRAEFQAAGFLCAYVEADLLERVLCVQKSRGTMDVIRTALARRLIRGGLSIAGVGYVRWSDRDAIPQAADFLLAEENVTTAVVFGIVVGEDGREFVSGSLRTKNAALAVDSFLKKALGKDARGKPFGGGRTRAGGFEIDVGFLSTGGGDRQDREAKWGLFERQIRRKLLHTAGFDVEKDEHDLEDPEARPLIPEEGAAE